MRMRLWGISIYVVGQLKSSKEWKSVQNDT